MQPCQRVVFDKGSERPGLEEFLWKSDLLNICFLKDTLAAISRTLESQSVVTGRSLRKWCLGLEWCGVGGVK